MRVINFARWQAATGIKPADVVKAVLTGYDLDGDRVFWFEHGPSEEGSLIGCGVDQAHLHVIVDAPFSFQDFVSATAKASQFKWQDQSGSTAHESVSVWASYLIAASMDRSVAAQNVGRIGSQFFRRVIAGVVNRPDAWNYRTHPHLGNVWETVRSFGCQST
jgi:ATP adenylyltransferase